MFQHFMLAFGTAVLLANPGLAGKAFAVTIEQAKAQCIEQLKPIVRNCVRQKVMASGGGPGQYIDGCKSQVTAQFTACVAKLSGAESLKSNPLEAAKKSAPAAARVTHDAKQNAVVPPRTIADITAILDSEQPDPARLAKLQASADAPEPKSDAIAKASFLYGRSLVRAELGRFREALADSDRAVDLASGRVDLFVLNTYRMTASLNHARAGDPKAALRILLKVAEDTERSPNKGFLFTAYRQIAIVELSLGNFDRAQSYMAKLSELWKSARSFQGFSDHGPIWEGNVEDIRARLFEARGQLEEAVRANQRAEQLRRSNIEKSAAAFIAMPRSTLEQLADSLLLSGARLKSRLGRVAEAESDARRALLNRLQSTGKYHPAAAQSIAIFGSLLIEQGRYGEARKLLDATIDIYRQIGVPEDAQNYVSTLTMLAAVMALEGRWTEAGESFDAVERAVGGWEVNRRENVLLSHGYIEALFKTQKTDAGLAAARRLLEIKRANFGDQHPETVLARGHYAVGLARVKQDADALKEFRAAVPLLTATTYNTDNDDVLNAAARTRYTQLVVESYIDLLGRSGGLDRIAVANETFSLSDAIRSRSVQRALTASGARMTTADPVLAASVRQEQDLRQQIGTQLGRLNSLLALPAAERDEAGVAALRKDIDKLRADHAKVRADIDRRFPDYADLIDPKPPTLRDVKQILKPDEVLLSFYFGRDGSFVWAIPKEGAVAFSTIKDSAAAVETKINKLREALEPQAEMISDIPPFDLALSHELYKSLLEPVKSGWQDAKNLIVVTNGALGLLPLSVLTVAPHHLSDEGPTFAGYRSAPWLGRSHAVTMVPSASALRTLRSLPPGSSKRDKLIAFGDPHFNENDTGTNSTAPQQVADAAQTRGVPLNRRASPQTQGTDNAGLAQLPRLPDTADELRSIAVALEADPTKALYLGREANERTVKQANLSGFRIIAFATHGLVPGELDGLDQPALALSAPSIAGVEGDGLLTMQEILSLKLDADWVVLSACNTGAAAGAGAEAASGLARAFFYAGTRAVLVTNWSVHSQSARELVSDLFRRQSADAKISRGESLQQAMMALLDGEGFLDNAGNTAFTYAHPLFWAPYTIIGDGS